MCHIIYFNHQFSKMTVWPGRDLLKLWLRTKTIKKGRIILSLTKLEYGTIYKLRDISTGNIRPTEYNC